MPVRHLAALLIIALAALQPTTAHVHRQLLIIVDGLRPDYVTPNVMPNLVALGKRGVMFEHHHSVFPTVTRVNAASIATGAYPQSHGLLGNSVFFPKVDATKFLDTADRESLLKVARAEGRLLTAPTLAEMLRDAGRRLLVVSSGSAGSALLNNPTVAGGAILHFQFAEPAQYMEDLERLGPLPKADARDGSLDRFAVDAFLKVGIPKVDPSVTIMWLSDLDTAAHAHGVGTPATIATLEHVDNDIKIVLDGLSAAHLLDDYDIWVSSDHGFSTYTGAPDVSALLQPYMRALPDGSPRIVANGGAVYVRDGDEATISAITGTLQRTAGIGAIFTRAATPWQFEGHVPGTLSFDAIRWQHDRSAQILYSPDWTDAANADGRPGTTASRGTAGHGSSSPWDVHNTAIAAGPDVRSGRTIQTPSANVDFAPTFLELLGIAIPSSIEGRSLREALTTRDQQASPTVRPFDATTRTADGTYALTAAFSIVQSAGKEYRYFDRTTVVRQPRSERDNPR
ncbi:MAG TPA: alkaline phosphatase family protein [Vicinamibacterales bacterium]|jgi:arylsulfatase A-like enzyme